jgi:Na+-transporting NADH:ubiquinone oxidoreductase subunit C
MPLSTLEKGELAVSEQQQPSPIPNPKKGPSDFQIIGFVVVLSFVCALILAVLASALKEPQEIAKELDRSEQMLIASRIFSHEGYFQIQNEAGEYVPAKYAGNGKLVPGSKSDIATKNEILDIYKTRLESALVNSKGELVSFKEAGINEDQYIAEYKKTGYYRQPQKLIYKILPNPDNGENKEAEPIGYVIPVNGFGLWDAIYGYLAIKPDGETVIGISWYEQKETPGLGANIAEADWQSEFHGKKIFQPDSGGQINIKSAPVGITVVKGKVAEVLGDAPKAKAAVDGMPGATLTGNGVTTAYREILAEYRPFFIKIHDKTETK